MLQTLFKYTNPYVILTLKSKYLNPFLLVGLGDHFAQRTILRPKNIYVKFQPNRDEDDIFFLSLTNSASQPQLSFFDEHSQVMLYSVGGVQNLV